MLKFKTYTFLFIFTMCGLSLAREQYGLKPSQLEMAQWCFDKAQRHSGLTAKNPRYSPQNLPIFLLTKAELSAEVCPTDPQNCQGIAGLFDTKRRIILLRADLNPDQDLTSSSFLIHEMVHALQSEFHSEEEMFGTCEKLYETEKAAYQAQDAFLKSEGQFFRAGNFLRFFTCDEPQK